MKTQILWWKRTKKAKKAFFILTSSFAMCCNMLQTLKRQRNTETASFWSGIILSDKHTPNAIIINSLFDKKCFTVLNSHTFLFEILYSVIWVFLKSLTQ